MPHIASLKRPLRSARVRPSKREMRFTVGLQAGLAREVESYAKTSGTSMSRALAALVRMGIESQNTRKREFFQKLKSNLKNDDPRQQDRLVDEFRSLILGQ